MSNLQRNRESSLFLHFLGAQLLSILQLLKTTLATIDLVWTDRGWISIGKVHIWFSTGLDPDREHADMTRPVCLSNQLDLRVMDLLMSHVNVSSYIARAFSLCIIQ